MESLRSVPIQAWRDGDFSGVAGLVLKNPATGQPFQGNRIPQSMFSKTAKASIGLWPQQNFGGATTTTNNLLITAPDRFSDGLLTIKIDHELTSKDRLSGRYSRAPHDETTTPGLPTFEQIIPPHNQVALINWTHIFTPKLRGSFNFRGDFTGQPFADFMLGEPFTASRVVGKGVETGRSWWHGYYIQDDWKISHKLTLNIGVRYEYISPLVDNLDRRSTFWPLTNDYNSGITPEILVANPSYCATTTRPCAGVGDVLHLDGVSRRAAYKADRNNWAPRFGFAYSLDPKTVIRGGYGIFYTNSQAFLNNFVINRRQPPFAETQQITSSTATPQIDIANPFVSASAALVVGTQNINPDFKEGYTQQWNLTVPGVELHADREVRQFPSTGQLQFSAFPTCPSPLNVLE